MTPKMLHRMADNVQGGIEQLLLHASTLGYQMDKDALNGAVNYPPTAKPMGWASGIN